MSQLETGNMIAINPIDVIKKSAKINKVEPINDLTAYAKWWTYEYWTQPILREPGLVLDGITNQGERYRMKEIFVFVSLCLCNTFILTLYLPSLLLQI